MKDDLDLDAIEKHARVIRDEFEWPSPALTTTGMAICIIQLCQALRAERDSSAAELRERKALLP